MKFVEKGWIGGGNPLTPEEICIMALGRIEQDANQFRDFVDILKGTKGMDIMAGTLECTFTNALLLSHYLLVSHTLDIKCLHYSL